MKNLDIRNAHLHEMPFLIDLAAKELWNPGLNDSELFFRTDPNGFHFIFKDGQPAGCISAVNYNNQFGFIGLHIIRSEFRNQGIGSFLLNYALQKLGNINIGLNCFSHQVNYYEKFGFKSAHNILTFQGIAEGKLIMAENIVSPFMHPFKYLEEYDKKCFPSCRKDFLTNWLSQAKSLLLAKLSDKRYSGFGLFRPCLNGYKISPLYADDLQTTEELLFALVGHMEQGSSFYIELPETNECAVTLAKKFNLKKVNETVRMYTKTEPDIQLKNIYSFASFEIG